MAPDKQNDKPDADRITLLYKQPHPDLKSINTATLSYTPQYTYRLENGIFMSKALANSTRNIDSDDGDHPKADSRGQDPAPVSSNTVAHPLGKEVRLEGFGPVLLYSEPSGEDGVRLHLRDDKPLLARLQDIDLSEPSIDILLSANPEITLVDPEEGLELFGSEGQAAAGEGGGSSEEPGSGGTSSGPSVVRSGTTSENFTNSTTGLCLHASESEAVDSSSEEPKNDGRLSNRKPIKSSSPNRQGPQRCPVCGKVFGNASALAKHKLTHSDERRYVCSMCAKAFKRQDHLNGHMLTHRNKKPYECKAEGCGKSYCDARSLRRHTENHHSGSNSSSTTPEPSPPTCIQYAPPPPPREQKVSIGKYTNSSETTHLLSSKHTEPSKTQVISSSVSGNSKSSWILQANQTISKAVVSSSKPVECNLCHRKFKNIPALNGHMRLHGGYFKKDTDTRRFEKRESNTPPLQTASISVRALIEEKIILKRITKPSSTTGTGNVKSEPHSSSPPGSTTHDSTIKSDSGPERSSSDPGILKQTDSLLAAQLNHNRTFSLDEYTEDTGILSPSLQSGVFQDGPDSVLLEGVDSSSLEESINAADLEDIAIEDYQSAGESLPSPRSFPHHQDVQSVLDSPLPANLAEFAYDHSQNTESQTSSQNYNSSTSNLAFPDPPLSQESNFPTKIQGVTSSSSNTAYFSPSITSTSEPSLIPTRNSLNSSSNQGGTLQSQMMPNSNDPLLSSSPKDFSHRSRKFDFHALKFLQNNNSDRNSSTQNLTGIILDRNGDLKFIQSTTNKKIARNSPTKHENGGKLMKSISTQSKPAFLKNGEEISSVLVESIKEGNHDVFVAPSLNMTPVHIMRKRPRMEFLSKTPHRSRLRNIRKSYGSTALHYTPPPMLAPSRQGPGLYWQAATSSPSSTTLSKGSNWDEGSDIPESDAKPHINIGPDYQCDIPDIVTINNRDKLKEHTLWDAKHCKVVTDIEVEKYLEFACCAAVPGGGRNKEHALHLLHICHGQIQEAILKLMQPTTWLPMGHPLLTFEYSDCEKWSLKEMETFCQALLKYDKDFAMVSKELSTKTAKQCVQFYYMWKKVCPEDYKRVRLLRKKHREPEIEAESSKIDNPNGDADIVTTTSSEGRLFVCEYNDCSASFNSRAALNGHIRIHVGGTATRCPTPDKRSPQQLSDPVEEFPCKLCGKVFSKVKSRSAHMKSHRPPEAELRKLKTTDNSKTTEQEQLSSNKNPAVSSSINFQTP